MNIILTLLYLFTTFKQCDAVAFEGDWTTENKQLVNYAVDYVGSKLKEKTHLTSCETFGKIFGKITFIYGKENTIGYCSMLEYGGCIDGNRIYIIEFSHESYRRTKKMAVVEARNLIIHELGHAFFRPLNVTVPKRLIDKDGFYIVEYAPRTWWQHPCTIKEESNCTSEVLADMFIGWMFNVWAKDSCGKERFNYMKENMPEFLYKRLYRKLYELPLAL